MAAAPVRRVRTERVLCPGPSVYVPAGIAMPKIYTDRRSVVSHSPLDKDAPHGS